jgi:catechol 2,3-dioxygenase-like lactoylglutathione lyase family enzyme
MSTSRQQPSARSRGRERRTAVITGAHVIVFSPAADEVRAFLGDKLGFPGVDAGGGWPILALPPAELAVHPDDRPRHELYLMCDDLDATLAELAEAGVRAAAPITEQAWGRLTVLTLPDGSDIGLYEPRHARPAH